MTAQEAGMGLLATSADRATTKRAQELVDLGVARWVYDTQVADVVGLVRPGTDRAYLVVYLADEDFEVSEDWPALCEWFARCGREATALQAHPILGQVPVCGRCREFAGG